MPKDSNAFQQWWCLILDRFNLFHSKRHWEASCCMLHDTMILETWRLQHLVDEALKRSKWHLIFSDVLRFSRLSTWSLENSNLIYVDQVCLRYSMATTKPISPPKLQKDTADTKRGQPVWWVSPGNRSRTWAEAEASQLVARTRSSVGPTLAILWITEISSW